MFVIILHCLIERMSENPKVSESVIKRMVSATRVESCVANIFMNLYKAHLSGHGVSEYIMRLMGPHSEMTADQRSFVVFWIMKILIESIRYRNIFSSAVMYTSSRALLDDEYIGYNAVYEQMRILKRVVQSATIDKITNHKCDWRTPYLTEPELSVWRDFLCDKVVTAGLSVLIGSVILPDDMGGDDRLSSILPKMKKDNVMGDIFTFAKCSPEIKTCPIVCDTLRLLQDIVININIIHKQSLNPAVHVSLGPALAAVVAAPVVAPAIVAIPPVAIAAPVAAAPAVAPAIIRPPLTIHIADGCNVEIVPINRGPSTSFASIAPAGLSVAPAALAAPAGPVKGLVTYPDDKKPDEPKKIKKQRKQPKIDSVSSSYIMVEKPYKKIKKTRGLASSVKLENSDKKKRKSSPTSSSSPTSFAKEQPQNVIDDAFTFAEQAEAFLTALLESGTEIRKEIRDILTSIINLRNPRERTNDTLSQKITNLKMSLLGFYKLLPSNQQVIIENMCSIPESRHEGKRRKETN
jgi:hypothetical protein